MKKKHFSASILFAMRLTLPIALPFIFTLSVYANKVDAQAFLNRPVSVSVKQAEVFKVISLIQDQTGVKFLYSPEAIQSMRKIDYTAVSKKLKNVIEELFKPLRIDYKVVDDKVLLYSSSINDRKPVIPLPQQNIVGDEYKYKYARVLTGTITGEKDEPLDNVSVVVKDSLTGTVTNRNGVFTLNVGDGAVVLVISHTGYISQEITVPKGETKVSAKLGLENNPLNEVVVVGYGTQKKVNLTGAVASVGSDRLEARPITNLGNGLQGLIPNLNINRVSGVPGQGTTFNIRGGGVPANTDPLILVDGVQMDANLINPEDVETVSVLKDAASAADRKSVV